MRATYRPLVSSVLLLIGLLLALPWATAAQPFLTRPQPGSLEALVQSVVRVESRVPHNARTARSLGTSRSGSGVVIDNDGLVVTIGYLILQAEQIRVIDHVGVQHPAAFVGYDGASGFGLLRILGNDKPPAATLGRSVELAERDPVLVLAHGAEPGHSALITSLRTFAGYWEYLLEGAIFTTPPASDWSGAALLNRKLEVVGIGSLAVRDAAPNINLPGNMFVPIDALHPVLADLIATGGVRGPARPWLGLTLSEQYGRVIVLRATRGGPAAAVGIEEGDLVLEVAGVPVNGMEALYRNVWSLGAAGVEVPLRLVQKNRVTVVTVQSADRTFYYRASSMH